MESEMLSHQLWIGPVRFYFKDYLHLDFSNEFISDEEVDKLADWIHRLFPAAKMKHII